MSVNRDEAIARLLSEAAATMRTALDLASARADRLETATGTELAKLEADLKALQKETTETAKALQKDTADRDHKQNDLRQVHADRLTKLETQRGVVVALGGGLLGGAVTVVATLVAQALMK